MKSRRDKKNVVGPLARISALMVNPLARFLVGERGELRFPEVNYIFCVAKNLKIPKLHKISKPTC